MDNSSRAGQVQSRPTKGIAGQYSTGDDSPQLESHAEFHLHFPNGAQGKLLSSRL